MRVENYWNDIEILARTIYGEARGEYSRADGGLSALIGVGNVVMNRVAQKTWFGSTIRDVCLKPFQFSCWNAQDPNYQILMKDKIDHEVFKICQWVASSLGEKKWPDLTKGSNHYYSQSLAKTPKWASDKTPLARIGKHLFFKL